MKKILMAAAALCCAITMTVLTACTDDNNDNPTPTPPSTEQAETPTVDALNVTTDKSYVAYGELNDGFDAALQRRLQGNMMSPLDADCYVIDPAIIDQDNISMDEWKYMVRRCMSGESSFVLTQCTFKEFYDFGMAYVLAVMNITLENYYGDADPMAVAEARASAKRQVANMVRNAYIAGGQDDDAMTRGTEVNGWELDWENISQWPQEKQQAIMFDAYAFSANKEIYVLNAEASKYLNEEVPEQPSNDYEWGQKADAVADWLNRQGKDDAETRAGLKGFAQAATRAGSLNISDLMSAQTKEFVFDLKYNKRGEYGVATVYSALKVQYAAYSAYDFGGNVEYYQVRQNITVMNDKTFYPLDGNSWQPRHNDDNFDFARGAWMRWIDTKMWLEGSGTKSVVSAGPLNENGSSSGSTSSGGSFTTTTGYSDGLSVGASVGTSGLSVSAEYSHTWDYSASSGTSWDTSTNWSTNDLTTTFTQGNDANGTVAWAHKGNTPTTVEGTSASNVKALLKSTCVTDEQALWKIDNPSGAYTLKASFNVWNNIGLLKSSTWRFATIGQDNPHEISFELNTPNRFKLRWNNYIINYGNVQGDPILTGALDDYLEKTYGASSGNNCWAGLFISTEATANGSDNARAVFQTFKNSIRGLKQTLKKKGYGGTLVFGLKRDTEDEDNPIDKLTLNLDVTYEVGETYTEQVNGYDLTFKVTKKNQEVELSSVPSNFQGELVIPANILDNALTVTSLGHNCAVGRKGITAVTIPGTLRNVGFGALAELNITKINIPEGVQTVSSWSFNADKQLTKVYLPSTVTEIKDHAFYQCDAITEVHIKATTPPSVGSYGLNPAYKTATLYVPTGHKNKYATANYWKDFKNIVEEKSIDMKRKNYLSSVARAAMMLLAAMLSTATVWAENVSIGTVAEWNTFAGRVNDGETTLGGLLTADLDFAGETFTVVGNSAHTFCGTFDGAGHTVKGITVSKSGDVTANRQGLFGSVGTGGIVRNVTVTSSSFAGWDYVGGIAGFNGGTIENCHVTGTVIIGTNAMSKHYHGGIVGYNSSEYSTVSHCTSAAIVTNNDYTGCQNFGGIVGINSGGTVEHCLAVGATVSAVTNSGAIVGSNTGTLSHNYYGHCTVGEATSNIGIHGNDVTTNDGAVPAIILYDCGTEASGNGTTISSNTGSDKNVVLYGRTLWKDSDWNTLCLPFGLSSFTGTPLEDATVKALTSTDFADGTLTLNFSNNLTAIEAGKPYIIKWVSGTDIVNPVFTGVTIKNTTANVSTKYVDFVGTYSPVNIYTAENKNLYLGSGNNIYYPATTGFQVNACRAYFQLNGLTAGDPASSEAPVRAFVLNFGEGEETGIRSLTPDPSPKGEGSSYWYSLDGRRLSGKPTASGVYINNGRKVVIK